MNIIIPTPTNIQTKWQKFIEKENYIKTKKMSKRSTSILISSILFLLLKVDAQQLFLCDSIVNYKNDSVFIISECSFFRDLRFYPDFVIDTALYTTKDGGSGLKELKIIYKGNLATQKGMYFVYRDNRLDHSCELKNYEPNGKLIKYSWGFNLPSKLEMVKKFKDGEPHGCSFFYSYKTGKVIMRERYHKGQLIKRVQKYERWE